MNLELLFLTGLTDSYNPCSIGVLFISLTILIALGKKNLIGLFGLSYLTTIFATYFIIGLGFLKAFHLFGIHGFFGFLAGIILIVIGLVQLLPRSLKQLPVISWLNKCHIPININRRLNRGVFLAGIILGFLIGLCTVPCAGGIYLGAIGLLASRQNYWQAILGIFVFNLGFILPLTIIFILSSREAVLNKIKIANTKITSLSRYLIPIIMIVMGILLILFARK